MFYFFLLSDLQQTDQLIGRLRGLVSSSDHQTNWWCHHEKFVWWSQPLQVVRSSDCWSDHLTNHGTVSEVEWAFWTHRKSPKAWSKYCASYWTQLVIDRWFCLLVFQDRESRVREKKKRRGNQREVKGKKKEESESSRIPSKGLAGGDGEAGGRPRRWPRKGSGGGRGREEKDGILKR